MNRIKLFLAKRLFPELVHVERDASGNSGGAAGRELSSEFVKRVSYKTNNDNDFEDPEFDMDDIRNGYNTDSYIRQGVDKYVDQIFKEGYTISGTDPNVTEYIKLRLEYIAEATKTPTEQFLIDIAEDIVKYGNCMIVKSRTNDPNAFPQGQALTGLYGKDAVGGYFCADPVSMTCKRDDYGVVTEWQQETDVGKQTFSPEDVVHIYYKREKGAAYGTSFLIPVLDDVRALRQAEENVLKMMYRFIYPFYHVKVGTEDAPGSSSEVTQMQETIDSMDAEGGLVTTERVEIKPIASDQVIDADPYLKYMESRVFTGFGIPEIMWGRGNCYDEQTQTLTNHGFKYWYEVTKDDKIATYNPDMHCIEYHKPNHGLMDYVSHYIGKMIHFKSKHIDIMVSPQHDMWVCTNGRKDGNMKWKKMKAIDLYESGIDNFYFMEASSGNANGIHLDNIEIPYVEAHNDNGNNSRLTFDTNTFMRFAGYFISEGCLSPRAKGNGPKYRISLSQKKQAVFNDMVKCVEDLGLIYSVRTDRRDGTQEIVINHKSLWIFLKDNFGVYDKDRHISDYFKSLDKEALSEMLDALIKGDGTVDKRKGRTSKTYYSSSLKLCDDIQEICVNIGLMAKVKKSSIPHGFSKCPIHRVLISSSNKKPYRYCKQSMMSIVDYDGVMYCYNVPNHLFVTRRNGKIAIQGNTANRSTGDNMTSEMADRIRAMHKIIEIFFNSFIIKELLMEGGYDPVLNPDQFVGLKFNDNDVDVEIKKQVHAIYKYEHNAITEDEMREEMGMDPIEDSAREKLFVELITRENMRLEAELSAQSSESSDSDTGTKETNNKSKNSGGKPKNSDYVQNPNYDIGMVKDMLDNLDNSLDNYIRDCHACKIPVARDKVTNMITKSAGGIVFLCKNNDEIKKYVTKLSLMLDESLFNDIISTNACITDSSYISDIVGAKVDIFKKSLIRYIREGPGGI